jgi:hypothetical protein
MIMPAKRKALAVDLQRRVRPRREEIAHIEISVDEEHCQLNTNQDSSSVQTDSDQVRSTLSQKHTLTIQ